jgi:hypothetical protein
MQQSVRNARVSIKFCGAYIHWNDPNAYLHIDLLTYLLAYLLTYLLPYSMDYSPS